MKQKNFKVLFLIYLFYIAIHLKFVSLLFENRILKILNVLLNTLGESKSEVLVHFVQHFIVHLGDGITNIVFQLIEGFRMIRRKYVSGRLSKY